MFSIEEVGLSATLKGVVVGAACDAVLSSAADEEVIACGRSDGVVTATTIESVVVFSENDELRMSIGVNDVAAAATGDLSWSDDDGEIDIVEFQLGGCARRHLGEVNDEGFCLGLAAACGGGIGWWWCAAVEDDGLSGCCGSCGGDDGANVKLSIAWQGVDEALHLLDQALFCICGGFSLADGLNKGILRLVRGLGRG